MKCIFNAMRGTRKPREIFALFIDRKIGDRKIRLPTSHTGEKLHKCDHCEKAFKFDNLKNSIDVYILGKDPDCEYCKKGFISSSSTLKTYQKSHWGEIFYI